MGELGVNKRVNEECQDPRLIGFGVRSELEEIAIGAVETSPYAMLVVDAEGKIQLFNRESEMLFGYHRSEVLNRPVELLMPEAMRIGHKQLREGFVDHPKVRQMGADRKKLVALTRTGKHIPVVIYLSPFMSISKGMLINAVVRRADVLDSEESSHVVATDE